MMLTKFEAAMGGLGALITVLTGLALGLRWIYRQGVSSSRLVSSIDQNTEATGKLSASFAAFSEKTGDSLLDHEKRLTRVEDKQAAIERTGHA
jgi:hypothetical protein